eukprot:TRINITY_DN2492_c0_g1_i4.p1 TRINITY_DN2492_c0_g1~~TRINITY_DN2492_c0_g1_i4.p1  ORF type:complete len:633 (+),score=134.57 TRINITY_DN2492_c0_g1_i4:20-1918(+)
MFGLNLSKEELQKGLSQIEAVLPLVEGQLRKLAPTVKVQFKAQGLHGPKVEFEVSSRAKVQELFDHIPQECRPKFLLSLEHAFDKEDDLMLVELLRSESIGSDHKHDSQDSPTEPLSSDDDAKRENVSNIICLRGSDGHFRINVVPEGQDNDQGRIVEVDLDLVGGGRSILESIGDALSSQHPEYVQSLEHPQLRVADLERMFQRLIQSEDHETVQLAFQLVWPDYGLMLVGEEFRYDAFGMYFLALSHTDTWDDIRELVSYRYGIPSRHLRFSRNGQLIVDYNSKVAILGEQVFADIQVTVEPMFVMITGPDGEEFPFPLDQGTRLKELVNVVSQRYLIAKSRLFIFGPDGQFFDRRLRVPVSDLNVSRLKIVTAETCDKVSLVLIYKDQKYSVENISLLSSVAFMIGHWLKISNLQLSGEFQYVFCQSNPVRKFRENHMMYDLGVRVGALLEFVLVDECFPLTIQCLDGRQVRLAVNAEDAIEVVKSKLEGRTGMPADLQALVTPGVEFEDGQLLGSIGLKGGDTLHVLQKGSSSHKAFLMRHGLDSSASSNLGANMGIYKGMPIYSSNKPKLTIIPAKQAQPDGVDFSELASLDVNSLTLEQLQGWSRQLNDIRDSMRRLMMWSNQNFN